MICPINISKNLKDSYLRPIALKKNDDQDIDYLSSSKEPLIYEYTEKTYTFDQIIS
jgi:hypothetical protein